MEREVKISGGLPFSAVPTNTMTDQSIKQKPSDSNFAKIIQNEQMNERKSTENDLATPASPNLPQALQKLNSVQQPMTVKPKTISNKVDGLQQQPVEEITEEVAEDKTALVDVITSQLPVNFTPVIVNPLIPINLISCAGGLQPSKGGSDDLKLPSKAVDGISLNGAVTARTTLAAISTAIATTMALPITADPTSTNQRDGEIFATEKAAAQNAFGVSVYSAADLNPTLVGDTVSLSNLELLELPINAGKAGNSSAVIGNELATFSATAPIVLEDKHSLAASKSILTSVSEKTLLSSVEVPIVKSDDVVKKIQEEALWIQQVNFTSEQKITNNKKPEEGLTAKIIQNPLDLLAPLAASNAIVSNVETKATKKESAQKSEGQALQGVQTDESVNLVFQQSPLGQTTVGDKKGFLFDESNQKAVNDLPKQVLEITSKEIQDGGAQKAILNVDSGRIQNLDKVHEQSSKESTATLTFSAAGAIKDPMVSVKYASNESSENFSNDKPLKEAVSGVSPLNSEAAREGIFNPIKAQMAASDQDDSMNFSSQLSTPILASHNGKTHDVVQLFSEVSQMHSAPTDPHQVIPQVTDHLRLLDKTGSSEMILRLKPEHLGEITLRVAMDNGLLNATFKSESSEVRHLIESSLPQLKQELMNQGFKVDSVGVASGQLQDFADRQTQSFQQFSQQNPQSQGENSSSRRQYSQNESSDDLEMSEAINDELADANVDYRV